MHCVCQHKTYVQLDWSVGECAARAVLLSCEKEHSAIHLENINHASKKVQGHLEQSHRKIIGVGHKSDLEMVRSIVLRV